MPLSSSFCLFGILNPKPYHLMRGHEVLPGSCKQEGPRQLERGLGDLPIQMSMFTANPKKLETGFGTISTGDPNILLFKD